MWVDIYLFVIQSVKTKKMTYKGIFAFIICINTYLFTFGQNIPLVFFDADVERSHLILEWLITDSTVNQPFEIQRSSDGLIFETIGTQSFTTDAHYEYTDSSAKGYYSILYYRLRQKQNDLFALYSPTVILQKVNLSSKDPIVFPNPVDDVLNLDYSPEGGGWMFIKISDLAGRILYQSPKLSNAHAPKWNVSVLPTGIYQIIIISQSAVKTVSWMKM